MIIVEGWEGILPDDDSGGMGGGITMTVESWEGVSLDDDSGGLGGGIT